MKLSDYERSILAGDFGEEAQKILEVMVKVYEINDAKGFVEIKEVMLAGSQCLSTSGELGIKFLTGLADSGIHFKAKTITDTVSIDLKGWKRLKIPQEYARKQQKSVNALIKMGVVPTWNCTPYLTGSIHRYGEHLAYVETACVIFANSYFGARTNREADISALAAAITGKTPNYGLHFSDNREGKVLINIETELKTTSDYDALGNYVGKIAGSKIPVFKKMDQNVSTQALMQLGAALATTGAVGLFHVFGVTPDIIVNPCKYGEMSIIQEITVTDGDMKQAYNELNTTRNTEIDFVSLGCPYYTFDKIREIASFLKGKKVKEGVEVWICTSETTKNIALKSGEIQTIEKAGAKIVVDTCMVVAPVKQLGFRNLATDSAKAQFYCSGLGLGVRFGDTPKCLQAAITGEWEE